jgi:hypothetical protein
MIERTKDPHINGKWYAIRCSKSLWVVGKFDYDGAEMTTACHPKDGRRIYCKSQSGAQKHADQLNAVDVTMRDYNDMQYAETP